MGWQYAGDVGMISGFAWAVIVNYQESRPWFRRPWLHAGGMVAGYYLGKAFGAWEDHQLQSALASYGRKGYDIPEDRKALFAPREYK